MTEREIQRVGYLVVSSDRGLCGGLNVNLFRVLLKEMADWHAKVIETDLGLIGNKAESFFRSVVATCLFFGARCWREPTLRDLVGGVKSMFDAFEEGRIDRLFIIS